MTVCVSISMCLLSPFPSPFDICGAIGYFIPFVREKDNVMDKCCLPGYYSHLEHLLLVGGKYYFCDSYHLSLWIKQGVKGSLFLNKLQNYFQFLITSEK